MKSGIHPNYFPETTITCSCGTVFETGSTVENMKTEICSQCHPFYTGKKKFIDVAGRVDRFKKLSEKSEAKKFAKAKVVKTKAEVKKVEVKKEDKDTKSAA
jgi:large subunit ribosomal protein L31